MIFKGKFKGSPNLLVVIIGVLMFGVLGFWIIEDGFSFLDSLYMAVITLSTVGFKEVHPLSDNGKIFTVVLIIFGAGTAAYTFGVLAQFVVEGQLRKIMGKRKMEKQINKLKDHYIICGYGRVGSQVCHEFASRKVSFVVIENNPESLEELAKTDFIYIEGDSIEDEVLKSARIEKARGLVSTMASEADNVYLALSARYLNPGLTITCRADSAEAEKKIHRAGADRVISPYIIGGLRMALATLRPNVVDFLQVSASGPHGNFRIEELYIKEGSPLANYKLKDNDIRAELGLMVIGVRKPEGDMIRNPSADTVIEPGDILILMGDALQLEKLEDITEV